MFNKISTLMLAFCLAFALNLSAQVPTATVKYAVKVEGNVDPQMAMLQATTASLAFKDDKLKFDISMMGMMGAQMIIDHKQKAGISLLDMMGNKSSIALEKEKYQDLGKSTEGFNGLTATTETAEFAGYKATAYTISRPELEAQGISLKLYLCEALLPKNQTTLGYFFKDIKGLPLAIEVNTGNEGKFTLYAIEVSKADINKNVFSIKAPKDYPAKSSDELMQMFNFGQ